MTEAKFTKGPWFVAADTFVYGQGPNGTNSFFLDVTFPGLERISNEEAKARMVKSHIMKPLNCLDLISGFLQTSTRQGT